MPPLPQQQGGGKAAPDFIPDAPTPDFIPDKAPDPEGDALRNPLVMEARAHAQAAEQPKAAMRNAHGPTTLDEPSINEDLATRARRASGNTFRPTEFDPEGEAIGGGAMATLGMAGQAITNPILAARGLAGGYLGGKAGAYGGGKVGHLIDKVIGGHTAEDVGTYGGGTVGGLVGGGLAMHPGMTEIGNESLSKISPKLADYLFHIDEPYVPQGPQRMGNPAFEEEHGEKLDLASKARQKEIVEQEKLREQDAAAKTRRGDLVDKATRDSARQNLRSGVAVIQEPKAEVQGEIPREMYSVPRNELLENARRGKPGAADVLRDIGKPIIFEPKEGTGYPGPRAEAGEPAQTEMPTEERRAAPRTNVEGPRIEHTAMMQKARTILNDPNASLRDKAIAQAQLEHLQTPESRTEKPPNFRIERPAKQGKPRT